EEELVMWYLKLIESTRPRISKLMKSGFELPTAIIEVLSGIGVKENHVKMALEETKLEAKNFENWSEDNTNSFAWVLRDVSKPTLIVANKMDLPTSAENFKRIQDEYSDMIVVPASAEAELTLRRAEQKGFIKYIPGEERFEILNRVALTDRQKWALSYIRKAVLGEYMRTGVQFAINVAILKLLRMNSVYPVYDSQKLSDKQGNVLPDVYLLPSGSTVFDLAKEVHTELAKGLLYAVDARSGLRLPSEYTIKDRDVLSIISTSKKKK
ncbi:MAG: TGS domain-containing protein, partial [archaeon]|nr:TGS domain-containing protein [archaeon]